ncbi:hypothetical protein [Lachnoclostridium sp. Marseille-P6806]|uniref:hypothetical protein n=1 Tax=Lachnoclostridium sp. Marseille-P6806 TaxID=2364793 RepID=UPI001030C0A4|nr:hypothetical protein [Lachnoclostridium sp. Marseille-P6806]
MVRKTYQVRRIYLSDHKKLTGYWANFAKYGNLNGEGLPRWESSTDAARIFEMGEHIGVIPERFQELYRIMEEGEAEENGALCPEPAAEML